MARIAAGGSLKSTVHRHLTIAAPSTEKSSDSSR
jgi:hypothetical protein